jgi:hypothetical protein
VGGKGVGTDVGRTLAGMSLGRVVGGMLLGFIVSVTVTGTGTGLFVADGMLLGFIVDVTVTGTGTGLFVAVSEGKVEGSYLGTDVGRTSAGISLWTCTVGGMLLGFIVSVIQ